MGSVVCLMCAKWCACGRKDCGTMNEDCTLYRVLNQECTVDAKWCRMEKRLVQMEEEEFEHHGDNDDYYDD